MRTVHAFAMLGLAATLAGCTPNPSGRSGADAPANELYGVWAPTTYVLNGKDHALTGIMIITPRYFMGNATYKSSATGVDANANSGPYYLEDGHIVLNQWMQLHYRTENPSENLLTEGVVEKIRYEVEGDTLTFHFPSGNRYISKRLRNADIPATASEDLTPPK